MFCLFSILYIKSDLDFTQLETHSLFSTGQSPIETQSVLYNFNDKIMSNIVHRQLVFITITL